MVSVPSAGVSDVCELEFRMFFKAKNSWFKTKTPPPPPPPVSTLDGGMAWERGCGKPASLASHTLCREV